MAQLDTLHFLPPLHSRDNAQIEDHWLYVSTPEVEPVNVVITTGSGVEVAGSPFVVANGAPLALQIGNGQLTGSPLMVQVSELNQALDNRGLVVEADAPVFANARYRSNVQAEALTAKGTKALGTSFRFIGMPNGSQQNIRSFVLGIMAVEDGTVVDITEFDPSITFAGSPLVSTDSWNIPLDAGQTFVLSGYANTNANLAGFVGALIESNLPIAVSSGNWCGALQVPTDQDITIDQIVPFDYLGTEHVFVEGNGLSQQERGMVVAVEDGTEIWLNDEAAPATTLQAGEWFLIPNSAYLGTTHRNIYVRTSLPAYVCQFLAGSPLLATPGMNFIPPLSCGLPNEVDEIPFIELIGNQSYGGGLFAITEAGATLQVNGVVQTGSEPVTGTTDWETYKIEDLTGNTKVASTGPVAVGLFGQSGSAGWAGYYSGFSLNTSADFALTAGVCAGDSAWVEFTGDTLGGATMTWDWGGLIAEPDADGTGYVVMPADPGTYEVSLVVEGEACADDESHTVTFYAPLSSASEVLVCDELLWEGQILSQSGNYTHVLPSTVTGCDSVLELSLTVVPSPAPALTDLTNDTSLFCPGEGAAIFGFETSPSYQYAWSFLATEATTWSALPDTSGWAAYAGEGTYELVAATGAPCFQTAVATVVAHEGECALLVPNVFSPNNDGDNDRFRIGGLEPFDGAHIQIFNRWGTLVFTHDDFGKSAGWDPRMDAAEGTYYFILEVPFRGDFVEVEDESGVETLYPPANIVRHGAFQLVR